jgi:hypothetical protein
MNIEIEFLAALFLKQFYFNYTFLPPDAEQNFSIQINNIRFFLRPRLKNCRSPKAIAYFFMAMAGPKQKNAQNI